MNQKSSKFSIYAILSLVIVATAVYLVMNRQLNISANSENDFVTNSIPFKLGDNEIVTSRSLDLAGRIITLKGSLITLSEAKRRGIIEGVFDQSGKELNETYLLSPNSSFIIKVKNISSSPALFF